MNSERLNRLQAFYGDFGAETLLRAMIKDEFQGKVALVSSFGADSALLIKLVADVDPNTPILFLDTGKHFQETLDYVDLLEKQLKLTNIRRLKPREDLINNIDKDGTLWQRQVNRCCWLRKVEPLNRVIESGEFEALITGRKRYQTSDRQDIDNVELFDDGLFRINPLCMWTKNDIKEKFKEFNLPQHPLVAKGYPSIGCKPCTNEVKPGEDERSGRWAHTSTEGKQKTECGIHTGLEENVSDWLGGGL